LVKLEFHIFILFFCWPVSELQCIKFSWEFIFDIIFWLKTLYLFLSHEKVKELVISNLLKSWGYLKRFQRYKQMKKIIFYSARKTANFFLRQKWTFWKKIHKTGPNRDNLIFFFSTESWERARLVSIQLEVIE